MVEDFLQNRDQPPLGIWHWKQTFEHRKPRFEVFKYIGFEPRRGLYFFRSRDEGSVIWRRWEDLNDFGFGPFMLDMVELRKNFPDVLSVRSGFW